MCEMSAVTLLDGIWNDSTICVIHIWISQKFRETGYLKIGKVPFAAESMKGMGQQLAVYIVTSSAHVEHL